MDAVFEQKYETCFYTTQEAMKEHIHDRIFRQLIWNKVYRRKLIENVRFSEWKKKKIDDEFFTYKVLGNAKVLAHSSKICYAYRQQMDSIMHVISETNRLQAVEAKIQRHAYIKENFSCAGKYQRKRFMVYLVFIRDRWRCEIWTVNLQSV